MGFLEYRKNGIAFCIRAMGMAFRFTAARGSVCCVYIHITLRNREVQCTQVPIALVGLPIRCFLRIMVGGN
jgi:hypothetical protein